MIVLGISGGFGHDAAACLVRDGTVVAMAEEERLCRVRHAMGALPVRSTTYCLAAAGLPTSAVDVIAASWDPSLDPTDPDLETRLRTFVEHPLWKGARPRVERIDHHLAHAASALLPARLTRAAVLVIDGNGERWATSVGRADGPRVAWSERFGPRSSLGHFYTAVTEWAGFGPHEEGKLMGLAAYGRIERPMPSIRVVADSVEVELPLAEDLPAEHRFSELRRLWMRSLVASYGDAAMPEHRWNASRGRLERVPWIGPRERNVAAAAQAVLVDAVCALARRAVDAAGSRELVLAGGVALNCGANAALLERGIVDRVHACPAAGDAGGALGAALLIAAANGGSLRPALPYVGPAFSHSDVRAELDRLGVEFDEHSDVSARVAALLANGAVVCWFQGRAEIGPRALGARSVLALPSTVAARDRVNSIKGREMWRPLSPSILAEEAPALVGDHASPFMLLAFRASDRLRNIAPAVVHADGSTRPQTVAPGEGLYRELLDQVRRQTGVPLLLNTSFNVAGEPIVSSPSDAVRSFFSCGADALAIGPFLVEKRRAVTSRAGG